MKINVLREIKTSSEVSHLKPLLESWLLLTEKYATQHGPKKSNPGSGDASWWYTERASVGILASAAWQIKGWTALEEYSTNKIEPGKKDVGTAARIKRGRCDLQISSNKSLYAFEAKQKAVLLGKTTANIAAQVTKTLGILESANRDARKLDKSEADIRFSLAFIAPMINARSVDILADDEKLEEVENRVAEFLSQLTPCISKKGLAFAYIFPKSSRDLLSPNKKFIYPGVVMIIKKIGRGNSIKHVKSD